MLDFILCTMIIQRRISKPLLLGSSQCSEKQIHKSVQSKLVKAVMEV